MPEKPKKESPARKVKASNAGKSVNLKRGIESSEEGSGAQSSDVTSTRSEAESNAPQSTADWDQGAWDDSGWDSEGEAAETKIDVESEAASRFEGADLNQSALGTGRFGKATARQAPPPAARAYTKFDGDRPRRGAEDRLNITPDVEAFAELICLKETQPPLSIGLFGDWGSGKSFFMQKLSEKIEELTGTGDDAEADGPFVSNVVQIKFNAWHYADANLWASLTADFMDQLRAGGAEGTRKYQYRQLVNDLAAQVGRAEAKQESVVAEVEMLNQQVATTTARITALKKEKEDTPATLLSEAATTHLDAFLDGNRAQVDEAGRALGYDGLSNDIATFRHEAQKALRISGQIKAIMRGVTRARGWNVLFFIGILTLVASLFWFGVTDFAASSSVPLAGSVAAMVVAGWRAARKVLPIIKAAAQYARDVGVREAELDRKLSAERRVLAELEKNAAAAEDQRAEQQAYVERYRAGAVGESPAALLHYFLHESAETKQFEQHLGIVSRVRRAFAQLETLLKEQQAKDTVDGSPPPDRIVLYIDDLDRCRDKQVVEVLEAVQLLLAFDHIVVIVGVDARWLEHSLKRFYDDKLTEADVSRAGTASVVDYLEKIFQIPFWLRPLTFGDGDEEGTYEKLVAGIVGGAVEDVPPPPAPAPPPQQRHAETRERITLDEPEIDLLKKLGPLAGRSPRAVTRILNVYRLIRVRRAGPALSRFLGHDGQPPEYPAIMLLLALDAGLRPAEASAVNKVLFSTEDVNDPLSYKIWQIGKSTEIEAQEHESRSLLEPIADRVMSAISGIENRLGRHLKWQDLNGALPEVGRYSFRHGGLQHWQQEK